jgi:hypothetical protein
MSMKKNQHEKGRSVPTENVHMKRRPVHEEKLMGEKSVCSLPKEKLA